jgi:hypothetical protein
MGAGGIPMGHITIQCTDQSIVKIQNVLSFELAQ